MIEMIGDFDLGRDPFNGVQKTTAIGAVAALLVDVGQPLRFWFTFLHPNVHSMLTEVTFCITCRSSAETTWGRR